MTSTRRFLGATGMVLVTVLGSTWALAKDKGDDGKPGKAEAAGEKGPGTKDKDRGPPGAPPGTPGTPAQPAKPAAAAANQPAPPSHAANENARAEHGKPDKAKSEKDKDKGAGLARAGEKQPEPAADGKALGHAQGPHGRGGEFKSRMRELRERFKSGEINKQQLATELEALEEDRKARRKQHSEQLQKRWGSRLANPAVTTELRHHERRMAHLNRMLLLAETERQGKAKDELVARIEKLTELENRRHERKMSALQGEGAKGPNQPAKQEGATP